MTGGATRKFTAVVCAVFGAILLFAASASAVGVVHEMRTDQVTYSSGADGFWTPERMREAKPLDVRLRAGEPKRSQLRPTPRSGADSGFNEAGSIPGSLPASSEYAAKPQISSPKFFSGLVPFNYYGTYPISANGRLFFTFRGNAFVCSGTSVSSKSKSVVTTAGHCVHDKKLGWAQNMIFIPAYYAQNAPFGVWPVQHAVSTRGWVKHEHFNGDYAALKVVRSPYGPLGNIVGMEGLAWGQPRRQVFQAIGYPGNQYNGELMFNCVSKQAGKDPFFRGPGPPDTGIGCNMGHGSSGGGWTIRNKKGRPFVNSVTSYGYREKANLLFGPYFTKKVRGLVRTTSDS